MCRKVARTVLPTTFSLTPAGNPDHRWLDQQPPAPHDLVGALEHRGGDPAGGGRGARSKRHRTWRLSPQLSAYRTWLVQPCSLASRAFPLAESRPGAPTTTPCTLATTSFPPKGDQRALGAASSSIALPGARPTWGPTPSPWQREGRHGAQAPSPRQREGRDGAQAPSPWQREGRDGAQAPSPRQREGRDGAQAPSPWKGEGWDGG